MNKVIQFSSKEDIQEQASLWVSRIDRGLSAQETKALQHWVKQSQYHQDTLFSLASLWDDFGVLNELSTLFPLENKQKNKRSSQSRFALAASIIFVVLSALLLHFSPFSLQNSKTDLVQNKRFETRIGEQENFVMNDGTSIHLNTNSRVDVAYNGQRRQLTLVYGEAKFDVAKDKKRPFTVHVGEKSFTALGTIFNVQKNSDQQMELVVTEGRVLITHAAETLAKITEQIVQLDTKKLPGLLVKSGEKAVINENQTLPVTKVSLDQVQRDLAWQQGMLIFNGEPLSLALKEVGRYTDTRFEMSDPTLADIKVAGYFKAGDIEGLLASLNFNFNIDHQKTSDKTIRLVAGQTQ